MADAARLSPVEAVLLHGLTFASASVMYDDRLDQVVAGMRTALDKVPLAQRQNRLCQAAQSICDAFGKRNHRAGAKDWAHANTIADAAVKDHHWAAFCAVAGSR